MSKPYQTDATSGPNQQKRSIQPLRYDSPLQLPVYTSSEVQIHRKLASGTLANVYLASLFGCQVAVKALKPPSDIADIATRSTAESDFARELAIQARLRHPNIVQLLGYMQTSDGRSLVFELATHGKANCVQFGYSRLTKALKVVRDVACALAAAHYQHVMHRDVKPSQVLLFGEDAKLADWGLAKVHDACNAGHSGETGTWEFMAPEVIRSEAYDCSADVYSFALLMYCFVCGINYPYQENYITAVQAASAVAKRGFRPTLSSRIPTNVQQVIRMCWGETPVERPNMSDVVDMLTACIEAAVKTEKDSVGSWALWPWS